MSTKEVSRVPIVYPDCAGIDVAKNVHYAALRVGADGEQPVRSFGGFTEDLQTLAGWLGDNGVRQVAMEATGIYWIPLYEVLDGCGFEVWLVNPAGLARPDRRKSDVLDCQWLQQLMSLGLLKRSHRPEDEVCELRALMRDRRQLTQHRGTFVQRMQKAMYQMNVQLDTVLTDISGKTGMAIIGAIVDGERDAVTLAKLRDPRVKASTEEVAKALRGNWRDEHLSALRDAYETYHHFSDQLARKEDEILAVARRLAVSYVDINDDADRRKSKPIKPCRKPWQRDMSRCAVEIFGTDLTAIPGVGIEAVLTLLSEVGADFSAFPTSKQFCQWLGLAPGTNISGGKRLSGAKRRGVQAAGQALRMSAMSLRRSNSVLGEQHRRRCSRMDSQRAIKATAHQLARIIYALVKSGKEYQEVDLTSIVQMEREAKQRKYLKRSAERLGMTVISAAEAERFARFQAAAA